MDKLQVCMIGANGLLSNCIGHYCNDNGIALNVYGISEPVSHAYDSFKKVDLVNAPLDYAELAKSDVIIYTAGAGIQFHLKENSDIVYHLNVMVPIQISNHLKDIGYTGKFITFGSYFEIGETAEDRSFNELDILQSALKAPNDYSVSKRVLSRFFSSFTAAFTSLHFILPTIYGETESGYRLIPYTLKSINENTPLTLTSGTQVRQYIYIEDVVKVLFAAINENLAGGIYNIEGVEEFSVKELVAMLFELKGQQMPEDIFGKTERVDVGMKVLRLNGSKLKNSLGFTPSTKIADVYQKYKF